MSDALQMKAAQRGKILSFATGIVLTGALSITVRVKGEDEASPREYPAIVSPTDPTSIELTVGIGMFDSVGTSTVDYVVVMADGRVLRLDDNVVIEVIDL